MQKEKVKTDVSLLNPKTPNFSFLCMPELLKLIFCTGLEGHKVYDL